MDDKTRFAFGYGLVLCWVGVSAVAVTLQVISRQRPSIQPMEPTARPVLEWTATQLRQRGATLHVVWLPFRAHVRDPSHPGLMSADTHKQQLSDAVMQHELHVAKGEFRADSDRHYRQAVHARLAKLVRSLQGSVVMVGDCTVRDYAAMMGGVDVHWRSAAGPTAMAEFWADVQGYDHVVWPLFEVHLLECTARPFAMPGQARFGGGDIPGALVKQEVPDLAAVKASPYPDVMVAARYGDRYVAVWAKRDGQLTDLPDSVYGPALVPWRRACALDPRKQHAAVVYCDSYMPHFELYAVGAD